MPQTRFFVQVRHCLSRGDQSSASMMMADNIFYYDVWTKNKSWCTSIISHKTYCGRLEKWKITLLGTLKNLFHVTPINFIEIMNHAILDSLGGIRMNYMKI